MAKFTAEFGIGDWIQFTADNKMVIGEIYKVEFVSTGSIYYSTDYGSVQEEHVVAARPDPLRKPDEPMRVGYHEHDTIEVERIE